MVKEGKAVMEGGGKEGEGKKERVDRSAHLQMRMSLHIL